MSRTTIALEIDDADEALLRDYAAFLEEMRSLAATAPDGEVLATCEQAVLARGREQQRRLLEQAVQDRINSSEKKMRP